MSIRDVSDNKLLATLSSSEDYQRLAPYLKQVSLQAEQVLYEVAELITEVYFPTEAVVSLVSLLEDGATTEIGLIGIEGMVGLPVLLGGNFTSMNQAVVQIAGQAVKINSQRIKQEFDRGGKLQKVLLRYTQTLLNQISQTVVCKTHFSIRQQFAYWLLAIHDRVQTEQLPLTQKLIAEMLGIRRASVSEAALPLREAGIIRYSRGQITILDRQALEATAGECYFLAQREQKRLHELPLLTSLKQGFLASQEIALS
ncbi:MAG: Crp/Fnr family transcriptional regulator [Cyanophyceae cyanobacterium]